MDAQTSTVSRALFALAAWIYRPLKRVVKPLLRRHSRLNRYCIALKEATKELIRPRRPPAPPPLAPKNLWVADPTPPTPSHPRLPEWLITEWRATHEIEPLLFPERSLVDTIPFYRVPSSRIATPYLQLRSALGSRVSHLFLVPWIERGGADLETINYLRALAERDLPGAVAVVTTENRISPWLNRVPDSTRVVEMGRMFPELTQVERENLLARTLIQMAPTVIHNMNSELCYRVFVKFGRALRHRSRLYASLFCGDVSEEGRNVGYSFSYLRNCYDYLTAVMCDNRAHLDELAETYAFDRSKMHVHYQPAPRVGRVERDHVARTPLRVLWAGRLDRQKRPDLLIATARRCLDAPISFHVFGTHLLGEDVYTGTLHGLPNVKTYGRFDGIPSLPITDFDVYLYTSQWDGLPNVLLEAMALGLPVIAADVGGIRELIEPGKNGYLVSPFDDVDGYVAALLDAVAHPEKLAAMADRAHDLMSTRHSWATFCQTIGSAPGYVQAALAPVSVPTHMTTKT